MQEPRRPQLLTVQPGGTIPDGYRISNRHERRGIVSQLRKKKRQTKRARVRLARKVDQVVKGRSV